MWFFNSPSFNKLLDGWPFNEIHLMTYGEQLARLLTDVFCSKKRIREAI
jgi:hypothetical protein